MGRKIAVLTGLASCAVAGGVYLLPLGITGAYLGRTLQGFGEACLYTGAAAWAIELAGVNRSAQALGYVSTGIWGGIAAGPAVGHWLGSFEGAAALQVVSALLGFLMLTRVPETYTPHPHPPARRWLPTSLIVPGLAIGFVNVQYPVVAGFLILHLQSHGNSGPMAFSAYAGMVLLSRFFLSGLPDRLQPGVTFYIGLACMAVGLLIIASGPPPVLAVFGAGLLGLGFSFPWSSIAAKVLKTTPAQQHGSAVGIMSAFYDLFVGISSFTAGFVAKNYGYPPTFLMAAGSIVIGAVVGRFVFTRRRRFPVADEQIHLVDAA